MALSNTCDSLQKLGIIQGYSKFGKLLLPFGEQQKRIDCWNRYWTDEKRQKVKTDISKAGEKLGIKAEMFQPFFKQIHLTLLSQQVCRQHRILVHLPAQPFTHVNSRRERVLMFLLIPSSIETVVFSPRSRTALLLSTFLSIVV